MLDSWKLKFSQQFPLVYTPAYTHTVHNVSTSADKIGSAPEKVLSMLLVSCVTEDFQDQGSIHIVFLPVRD